MAGGSGTRFWPLSRNARPKQLLDLLGGGTLIQATVARLQPLIPAERVLIVTTAALAEETRQQLPMLKPEQVIAEPVGRDTAACVCLAAVVVERLDPGATMVLLPADQVIAPASAFQAALQAGITSAETGRLVTYGIAPRHPATGYGYVQLGAAIHSIDAVPVHRVERFVEKPDLATAEAYLAQGDYRWNAGIFTWRVDTVLKQLDQFCPELTRPLRPLGKLYGSASFDSELAKAYAPLKRISIDYALMEHAREIACVCGAFDWDDVGSWDALYDHLPVTEDGLRQRGEVLAIDCKDSLFSNDTDKVLAAVGISGHTVVVTDDAVLVVPRGRSQDVKAVVEALKAKGLTARL
jgi:mannose-1-phosphate guanylyltransferase